MTIPPTCPDFVAHPHIGCYECRCASASESQGTSQIAEELNALGIPADVVQTGGFTMCVYIKTGDESYIYANPFGLGIYKDEDDNEGTNHFFTDEETPKQKAEQIIQTMKENNLQAKEQD